MVHGYHNHPLTAFIQLFPSFSLQSFYFYNSSLCQMFELLVQTFEQLIIMSFRSKHQFLSHILPRKIPNLFLLDHLLTHINYSPSFSCPFPWYVWMSTHSFSKQGVLAELICFMILEHFCFNSVQTSGLFIFKIFFLRQDIYLLFLLASVFTSSTFWYYF